MWESWGETKSLEENKELFLSSLLSTRIYFLPGGCGTSHHPS